MVLIIIVLGDVLVLDYELRKERRAFDLFFFLNWIMNWNCGFLMAMVVESSEEGS